MSAKRERILVELRRIHSENRLGLLQPAEVVQAAKPNSSPLHCKFEWNNGKAGHQYRLWQARELISVYVTVINRQSVPQYVSFRADRIGKGGGYRDMPTVLKSAELRKRMLAEAIDDLKTVEQRYIMLRDLVTSIKRIRVKFERVVSGKGKKKRA